MELGNIMFNPNKGQECPCPRYIIALLQDLDRELGRVMWNNTQEKYDSPFSNTGNLYKNKVFEVEAYNWNENKEQVYNFKYKNIKISWYKCLGRDTTINNMMSPDKAVDMYNKCIKSVLKEEINIF
jgi:hypothetical protein